MESGGGRNLYYRVSVPGRQAFTRAGTVSQARDLTHIDISKDSLEEILRIVRTIRGH